MGRLNPLEPKKILVFRALQLGDLLCAVPALRALRTHYPSSSILLVGLPWARAFAQRYSRYLDGFLEFPGYPGLPEQPMRMGDLPGFLRHVQSLQIDLAIQLHGCGTITNPLIAQFGARWNAGYYVPGQFCPEPKLFLPYPEKDPEIWRHLRLMEFLGVPPQGEYLEFEVTREDHQALRSIPGTNALKQGEYVCIHAGARDPRRRWASENFARIASSLIAQGTGVVLTGTEDERSLVDDLSARISGPHLNLAGQTELGSIAALVSDARMVICNDTGVSHLAAALRTPSIVIFSQSETQGWPPLDRQRHRVVCRLGGVKPEDVLKHVYDFEREENAPCAR